MKKKDWVLISGIISIFVLISGQFFIIKDIWREKDALFDLKYKTLSREAMDQLFRVKHTDGFSNALDLADKYAQDIWTNEINKGKTLNEKDLNAVKKETLEGVTKILNELQELSSLLSDYFKKQGFESDFT